MPTPDEITEDRGNTFRRALAALWSEQAQMPRAMGAYLGVYCDERKFVFFIVWVDQGIPKRRESYLHLHECDQNPALNFTTVFRTLIRTAGL